MNLFFYRKYLAKKTLTWCGHHGQVGRSLDELDVVRVGGVHQGQLVRALGFVQRLLVAGGDDGGAAEAGGVEVGGAAAVREEHGGGGGGGTGGRGPAEKKSLVSVHDRS